MRVNLTGKASDFLKIGVAAAGRGEIDTLKSVLEQKPEWLTRVGSHGRTMLWEAAYRGRLNAVAYVASKGADINARGCHYTPLLVEISPQCAAAYKKHLDVSAFLLEQGATYEICTAIYLGETDKVSEFLRIDPELVEREIPQHDPYVCPIPLHYAVAARNLDIARLLIEHQSPVQPYSESLIRFAIFRSQSKILDLLIQAGADIRQNKMPRGQIQNEQIVELLAKHGDNTNIDAGENGWPPIVYQSRGDRGGDVRRIKSLIEQGANVDIQNFKGQTALHCAAKTGFVDIAELLLKSGATVDVLDNNGDTALTTALRSTIEDKKQLQEVVVLLVDSGADVNLPDKQGRTPSQITARKQDGIDWNRILNRSNGQK